MTGYRVSVATNIILVIVVIWLVKREPSAASSFPVTSQIATRPAEVSTTDREISPTPKLASGAPTPAAVAQLQQLGFSRDAIVSALLEDYNRRSTQQLAALQKKYAPRLVPDREMVEFARQTQVDQTNLLKQSLGEAGYRAWDKEQTLRELNRARPPGDELAMSPEEAEQAYRLQKEFDEKNRELQEAMQDGVADKADASALQAQAQQALDAQLEQLLGKQRVAELRGNIDPATEVYRNFGELNPTPDQARAVAQAQEDYRARSAALAQQLNANPGDAANLTAQLKALNDAQDANLRQIFGAEAYDNLKKQNDPTFKTLQQYAGAWSLNDQQVQSVYNTVHAFQDQADSIRAAAELSQQAGQPVNWRQVNASIDQARQQTVAGLQNQLGAELVHRLEQNGVLTH